MERHIQTGDSRPDRRDPKTRVLLNDLIDLGGLTSLGALFVLFIFGLIFCFFSEAVLNQNRLR